MTDVQVARPVPKDLLGILAKDENKQKEIEAKAQEAIVAAKSPAPPNSSVATIQTPSPNKSTVKKIPMRIPEIPAFKGFKKTEPLPISDSARKDIPITTVSPPPESNAGDAEKKKLNPSASAFVFKPTASAFKPVRLPLLRRI